jgi:hypothetical protein
LKTALIQLIKPTDVQAKLAESLGLSFVDASGKMRSLADISTRLRDKLHDQGQAQRTATLATLAGTDGVRTLTALYDAGPARLEKWEKGVAKSGTAAEVARKKQDNLAGSIEQLRGSAETLAIIVGTALIPSLTDATRWLTNFLNQMQSGKGAGGQFVQTLNDIKNAFLGIVGAVRDTYSWLDRHKTITTALLSVVAATTTALITWKGATLALAAAQGIAAVSTTGWVTAFWALDAAISANPIGAAVTAVLALGAALVVVWNRSETFRKIVVGAFKGVIWILDKVAGGFSTLFSALGHVPGMGWARDAARAIDEARESTRKWVDNLNKLPRKKNVDVKIKFTGVTGSIKGQSIRVDSGDILGGQGSAIFGGKGDGTGLMGAKSMLAPFAASGSRYGLHVSSGLRRGAITSSGNVSNHASGNAIDLSDGTSGPSPKKLRFFNHAKSVWGSRLSELIYTPGGLGIKNGRPFRYTGQVAKDHYDHVHLAYRGGRGDGPGTRVANLARGAGLSGESLVTSVAISKAESGWRANASNRNSDGSIDRGYWQINSVHGGLSTFNPEGNARAMAKISRGGKDWRPWVTYTTGAYRQHLTAAAAAVGSAGGATSSGASRESLQGRLESNQNRLDVLRNQLGRVPAGKTGLKQRRAIQSQIRGLVASNRDLHGNLRNAPTATDIRAQQEQSGSRLVNRLAGPALKGIRAVAGEALRLGTSIEDEDTRYGQAERLFGQSEEDLGTVAGKKRRLSEISALRTLKKQQLVRQQKRARALAAAVKKYDGLLAKLRKARGKARGVKRAKMNERIKSYDDRRTELAAELKALGFAIGDTQLDLGDLAREAGEVAATPDTAATEAAEAATEAAQAAADAAANAPTALDKIGNDLSLIDLQERAGVYTPEQARAAKIAQLQAALRGDYGALSDRDRLEVMANLREATNAVAEALVDNSAAIRDLKASVDANTAFAQSVAATETFTLAKSLADVVSGQIAGFGLAGRALTTGSGALARY